jgi:hypothetical protein
MKALKITQVTGIIDSAIRQTAGSKKQAFRAMLPLARTALGLTEKENLPSEAFAALKAELGNRLAIQAADYHAGAFQSFQRTHYAFGKTTDGEADMFETRSTRTGHVQDAAGQLKLAERWKADTESKVAKLRDKFLEATLATEREEFLSKARSLLNGKKFSSAMERYGLDRPKLPAELAEVVNAGLAADARDESGNVKVKGGKGSSVTKATGTKPKAKATGTKPKAKATGTKPKAKATGTKPKETK